MGLQRRQNHGIHFRGLRDTLASIDGHKAGLFWSFSRRKVQQVLAICRYDQAPMAVVTMAVNWVMGRAKRKRQFDVR